jgi:hypothetical protein
MSSTKTTTGLKSIELDPDELSCGHSTTDLAKNTHPGFLTGSRSDNFGFTLPRVDRPSGDGDGLDLHQGSYAKSKQQSVF